MDFDGFVVGLAIAAVLLKDRRLFVPAVVLWINLRVLSLYYDLTGLQYDWAVNALADYASAAALIFLAGGGRAIAIIVMGYAVALIWHLGYAVSDQDAKAQYDYWYQMSYTAWGQAAVAALGGLDRGGGRRVLGPLSARLRGLSRGLGARALGAGRAALQRARGGPGG